ncbi:hypothetical protein [Bradyrhizobium sp. USDA 3240]
MLSRTLALFFLVVSISPQARAQTVRVFEWNKGRSPIALLFIHGIGGCAVPSGQKAANACAAGSVDSFKNPKAAKSWPEMIASDDHQLAANQLDDILPSSLKLGDLGVWGVDYSRLTNADCAPFSIPQTARLMRLKIESSGLFDRYEQIIIVAHSMGGLLTKSMLLEWQNAGDPDGMLARTIAVMFLGVPSQGSQRAPNPGIQSYFYKLLGADTIGGVCGRQAQDMFTGHLNTYLGDLEGRWEGLLNTRRAASHSTAPLVDCAYETVPEPLLYGITEAMIVDKLYAQTQCSSSQIALPTYHTMLPKPENLQDDVHSAFLTRSLDDLFRQWSQWSFTRFEFLPTDTFETFARVINRNQKSFVLRTEDVRGLKPAPGSFDGADNFVVMAKVARANPTICLDIEWPANGPGQAAFHPAGQCRR